MPRLVIKQFCLKATFFPLFLSSFFSHFLFSYCHSFHISEFHISGFWFSIIISWSEKKNGILKVLWDPKTLCLLYIKELKQRKNMNVAPKSLSNELKSNCVKGKDFGFLSRSFDLRRKMGPIMWDPGKASHEHPTFLHSWFSHSSIPQWLIMWGIWQ